MQGPQNHLERKGYAWISGPPQITLNEIIKLCFLSLLILITLNYFLIPKSIFIRKATLKHGTIENHLSSKPCFESSLNFSYFNFYLFNLWTSLGLQICCAHRKYLDYNGRNRQTQKRVFFLEMVALSKGTSSAPKFWKLWENEMKFWRYAKTVS